MRPETTHGAGRGARGYTLIEMLVVMGIILLLVSMVLLSISSMLRGSKMANTVNLFIAAADEARTAGITLRRTIQVDLTRLDTDGKLNRLTTIGANLLDPFEANNVVAANDQCCTHPPYAHATYFAADDTVKKHYRPQNWTVCTSDPVSLHIITDGTRCLRLESVNGASVGCYNTVFGAAGISSESNDYEVLAQARVKFMPGPRSTPNTTTWKGELGACFDEKNQNHYGINLRVEMNVNDPLNTVNRVQLFKTLGGAQQDPESGKPALRNLDEGVPSGTHMTVLKEGLWYNLKLSIRRFNNNGNPSTPVARIAGKVWVYGQLEPAEWTVGPTEDSTPLPIGYACLFASGNDLLVDDVFLDLRSLRALPNGMRVDMLFPEDGTGYKKGDPVKPAGTSPYNFPILFRPDGTAAKRYVIRLTDTTSNDKRYIVVEQNSGRTRPADSQTEALQQ